MYTKYILTKNDVITCIALLSELKNLVNDIKDSKIKKEILDFMYANFSIDDMAIFHNIGNIFSNMKYIEISND